MEIHHITAIVGYPQENVDDHIYNYARKNKGYNNKVNGFGWWGEKRSEKI